MDYNAQGFHINGSGYITKVKVRVKGS